DCALCCRGKPISHLHKRQYGLDVTLTYVFTGFMNKGELTKAPLTGIDLDVHYGLSFNVCTVIDDSPRGGQVMMLSIYLFIEDGVAKVNLQDSGKTLPVIDGNRSQICDVMKDQVLMAIHDSALEDTQYF
ncbi:hypothetical protein, partial [Serratia liquefaciens]|uniref:hypothetical protein n=1 Tax=Serratia liquefaciens TaxID=614 RepID=UPI0039060065